MAVLPIAPTRAGFLAFVRTRMGIPVEVLPDNSEFVDVAFELSLEITNRGVNCLSPRLYTEAVYNLGGSILLNVAQDAPGAPVIPGSDPAAAFFAYARSRFNMNGFVSGVIQSAGDETTNQSMVVQEAAKNFTLANLQQLKDPYGRAYLAIVQSYGDIWGVS